MAVKGIRSAERVIETFEAVARYQPVGAAELSRLMSDDNSAVHRALVTLAAVGWIERVDDQPRWAVTSRVGSIASGRSTLVHRVRPTLESLRDQTNESALLGVAEGTRIVVIDVCESHRTIRAAPKVGREVSVSTGALGQAILSRVLPAELPAFLDRDPDAELLERLALARTRGWAEKVHRGLNPEPDLHAVGSPILDPDGRPVAAIVVSGPIDRMPPPISALYGEHTAIAAARLSSRRDESRDGDS